MRIYTRTLKILTVVTALLYMIIFIDDSKFAWPELELVILLIAAGTPFQKLTYLPVLLSWIYLWVVIFKGSTYNRYWMLLSIGALCILITCEGYGIFASEYPTMINRNHWFIVTSSLFLTSSVLLLFRMFNTEHQ